MSRVGWAKWLPTPPHPQPLGVLCVLAGLKGSETEVSSGDSRLPLSPEEPGPLLTPGAKDAGKVTFWLVAWDTRAPREANTCNTGKVCRAAP